MNADCWARDVSANRAEMLSYTQGVLYHEFGASLAAPIWASVITLVSSVQGLSQSYAEATSLSRSISSARQPGKARLVLLIQLSMLMHGR